CRLATPITIKFEQLQSREGYDPQKESANFGPLWRGGEWHIRDITNTMTTVAFFLLKHAAQNREHWLQRFYEIEKAAVRPRKQGELQALLVMPSTEPQRFTGVLPERASYILLDILETAGVEVHATNSFRVTTRSYPAGTIVIPMNQPYAGFARALLIPRLYPDLRDASGRPIPPYDVTAHTLSLLMNVQPVFVRKPFQYQVPKPRGFAGCTGGGPVERTIGLYKSHVPAIDEGWTNWILQHGHPFYLRVHYSEIEDRQIRSSSMANKY